MRTRTPGAPQSIAEEDVRAEVDFNVVATASGRLAEVQGTGASATFSRARFVCVAALALPGSGLRSARGICSGRIAEAPRGRAGFGYAPIFVPDEQWPRRRARKGRSTKR